MRPYNVTGLGR